MNQPPQLPLKHNTCYKVAWLCALPESELVAARMMLDHEHRKSAHENDSDHNTYYFGDINGHNVVITCMPPGLPGNVSASTTVQQLRASFPNVKIYLFVGVGGGVPRRFQPRDPWKDDPSKDIYLGDVVIGWAERTGVPSVVQIDLNRYHGPEETELLSSMDKPSRQLLNALGSMLSDRVIGLSKAKYCEHLERFNTPNLAAKFKHPGREKDILFEKPYRHPNADNQTCSDCDVAHQVMNRPRKSTELVFHQGTILSSGRLMKNAEERDSLSQKYYDAICFDMEAAGVTDCTHALVIRGISDYADSHKNLSWQPYASAAAATVARELLFNIQPRVVETIERNDSGKQVSRDFSDCANITGADTIGQHSIDQSDNSVEQHNSPNSDMSDATTLADAQSRSLDSPSM